MAVRWLNRVLIAGPYMALCLSEREFGAALDWLKIPANERPRWINEGADATTHTFERRDGTTCIVCLDNRGSWSDVEVNGLLVHEATHVFDEAMERIRETNPGKEIKAYSIQAISQQLMSEFARRKKKR